MFPPIPCGSKPPECNHPCTRQSACGHALPYHNCHRDDEPCPPCTVLVEKWCMGNHKLLSHVPCHLKDVSCGSVCGKLLPCGQHKCTRVCHKAACVAPQSTKEDKKGKGKNKKKQKQEEKTRENGATEEKEEKKEENTLYSCGHKCDKPLRNCTHTCQALCHPNQPCPVTVCKEMVSALFLSFTLPVISVMDD